MWQCSSCGKKLFAPVAHDDLDGDTCPGHPVEKDALEEKRYTPGKRIFDALFITTPFVALFLIAYSITQGQYPSLIFAAFAIPVGNAYLSLNQSDE